ncbi:hypothetical protein TCAP_06556 [Tolypocladium capitatum]|uniref:Uncharacterized protein n=1 Tax=Tolypocladium capitatum TaxID=45235 RepID=A0A2K3Q7S3_9HYPO|nr:hypothetical protein TCAP_06556 [Tolypocladium capitatum]
MTEALGQLRQVSLPAHVILMERGSVRCGHLGRMQLAGAGRPVWTPPTPCRKRARPKPGGCSFENQVHRLCTAAPPPPPQPHQTPFTSLHLLWSRIAADPDEPPRPSPSDPDDSAIRGTGPVTESRDVFQHPPLSDTPLASSPALPFGEARRRRRPSSCSLPPTLQPARADTHTASGGHKAFPAFAS